MGKVTKKDVPIWQKLGHGKPRSRREFLGYGIIPFAAQALVPGALGLLVTPFQAAAASCATESAGVVPFVTLNLAGGASLCSNYMPLDASGAGLASYSKMGNGTGANIPARINEFGNPNFSANSQFIVGLQGAASQAARDRTAFVAGCVQSRDDSAENMFDVSGMAFKAGLIGSILPNLGIRGTPTGISQKPATLAPPPPLIVNNFASLANSIGYTAALKAGAISDVQRNKIAKLASNLSGSQARRLASINSVAHVQSLVECAGIKNVDLVAGGSSSIDPLLDANFGTRISQLYATNGINLAANGPNEQRVFSAMVYNALLGNAGSVNLERGGYDYHTGNRTDGDDRDREAGQAVGRMLEMAHMMQRPIFIYVTSDGSVVSTDSASAGSSWVSDRGNAGMFFTLMYHPAGRPATNGPQIGNYNLGQEAEEATPIGNNTEIAAQSVFANYTRFAYGAAGWETVFRRVIPRGGSLDGAVLASVIKVI